MSVDDVSGGSWFKEWILAPLRRVLGGESRPFSSPRVERAEAELWPKDRPLLSAVVPCYNHGHYVGEAVDSLLAQSWQDLEVLVVDDGSDAPETVQALENFSRPRTKVIHHDRNRGLPAARNTGIQRARGKYVCCLDADDKLHPTYVEKALCLMESNLGVDLVYAWAQVFGDEDRVWHAPQFDPSVLIYHNQLNPPGVFRRAAWEEVGGFREAMRQGYEDWEFWIRMARAGYRGYRIPEKLIYVRRVGRSFIHEAMDRHDQLVAEIRRYNPEVYGDLEWLDAVEQQKADVYVDRPLLNVADRGAFAALEEGVVRVIRPSLRPLRGQIGDLWEEAGGAEEETVVVCTVPVGEELLDRLYALTDHVYVLPHFLPRYAWEGFMDVVLEKVRLRR